jgi:hypothetical protein
MKVIEGKGKIVAIRTDGRFDDGRILKAVTMPSSAQNSHRNLQLLGQRQTSEIWADMKLPSRSRPHPLAKSSQERIWLA